MDLRYVYVKPRSEFGKQCFFEDVGPNVEENIFPDPILGRDYVRQFMADKYTQKSKQLALHKVQTTTTALKSTGILHLEGSWPKEIDPTDVETIKRFRRRVAKSDNWISCMLPLMNTMESCIMQNNAINIHGFYFDDMIPTELSILPSMQTINVYADKESNVRPANHVSWSTNTNRLAVAYCFKDRLESASYFSPNAYIWDLEITKEPVEILKSDSASVVIEFNPRDPSLLISGLMSGQVCSWDTRTGDTPVQISKPLNSHRNPANQALWISSKSNTEFFSSSNSGTVKWWDTRNMRRPTEVLVMDLEEPDSQDINVAVGISCLQYESTMGSKFLAGLENGVVLNINRKAITAREKLHTRFDCHRGPVLSIDRNPGSLKNFLTVGDWHAKVWTEETKENYLIRTARKGLSNPTGGCWSRSRLSLFFTIDTNGRLDAYDILQGATVPIHGIRLGEKALTMIKPHEDGRLLAIGSTDGNIYVVRCDGLLSTTFPNDKQLYAPYLERCSRYEKLADTRTREIRMAIAHTPVPSATEVASPSKSKSKDRSRDTRERIRIKEAERDKAKEKDTPRKSRAKKSMYRETPFANDTTMMEAEKQYFINVETERRIYDSMESREIEDIYKRHRKAEQEELEAQEASAQVDDGKAIEKARKRRPRLRRMRARKPLGTRFEVADSLEQIGALIEAESVKSEEFTSRSGRKKRALSEIPLKICPMGVCKPKVCCADVVKAEREQRELEESKELKKKHRMKRFIATEEEYKVPRLNIPVSSREVQKWKHKILEMNRSIPERTPLQKKRILLGKDAPPSVLTQDVKDAKRYLAAWRESLLSKAKSLSRCRSLSPMRKIVEGETDTVRTTRKKVRSVQDLVTSESCSTIDDIMKMSAKIAEVKTKISMPSTEMIQSTTDIIRKKQEEERGVYPRISEAYFPKYPE